MAQREDHPFGVQTMVKNQDPHVEPQDRTTATCKGQVSHDNFNRSSKES